MDEQGRGRRAATAARARVRHGLVERSDLLAEGLGSRAVTRAVHSGRLERMQAGTFRVAGAPGAWEQEVLAAVMAAGGDAVASHRSAARLWGIGDPDDETVEITVRRARSPVPRATVVHRSGDLADRWCTHRKAIPVTNPLRVLVDLGAVSPRWQVADALERALVARLVSLAAVEWARAAHARPGRSGTGVLGKVLDARALGSRPPDSLLEARMGSLLARHRLPTPVFQHEVRDGPRFVARVDFAYPDRLVAIEVDGLAAHASAEALQHDLARQNALVALGWRVLRFTWSDVVRRPASVADSIRSILS